MEIRWLNTWEEKGTPSSVLLLEKYIEQPLRGDELGLFKRPGSGTIFKRRQGGLGVIGGAT